MSVTTQISRITNEVSGQADKMQDILTVLRGKAAGGVGKAIQYSPVIAYIKNKTSYTTTGASITVDKSCTYKCTYVHYAYAAGSSTTYATRLYVNGSAIGTEHPCPAYNASSGQVVEESNVQLTADQTVEVRARTRSGSSYYTVAGMLVIEEV